MTGLDVIHRSISEARQATRFNDIFRRAGKSFARSSRQIVVRLRPVRSVTCLALSMRSFGAIAETFLWFDMVVSSVLVSHFIADDSNKCEAPAFLTDTAGGLVLPAGGEADFVSQRACHFA
jgi:hypothetical protein